MQKLPIRTLVISLALLSIAIILPRTLALNTFVNPDEPDWLLYSANFYHALVQDDYGATFQREHPGVPIMWAGTAAYAWSYPSYSDDVGNYLIGQESIGLFLRKQGYEPLDILVVARVFVVIINLLVLLTAFLLIVYLFGNYYFPTILVGFILTALDPFHIAHSRLLHLDASMGNFMFLSVVAFFGYQIKQRPFYLVSSGIAAGFAWLTKSPAFFLIPYIALAALCPPIYNYFFCSQKQDKNYFQELYNLARILLIWGLIGSVAYVILWPSMWVAPIETISRVLFKAYSYAEKGHGAPIFYNGEVVTGDPGFFFYPITYLWRTTPIVLSGLIFAILASITRSAPFHQSKIQRFIGFLTLYAILFVLFMNLGAKKWDRYIVSIYLPLNIVSAFGWSALFYWLMSIISKPQNFLARVSGPVIICTVIIIQSLNIWYVFPYMISYYNPLFGGIEKASEVLTIGWGEGLDLAGEYMSRKSNSEDLSVGSQYQIGSLSYFFKGNVIDLKFKPEKDIQTWLNLDYILVYAHQWQRQLPDSIFLDYFAQQTAEHIIRINQLDYVHIYNLRGPLRASPAFLTKHRARFIDWDHSIRLLNYDLPTVPLNPGERFQVKLQLQNIAPLDKNVHVLLRIIDASGQELLRSDTWPWGSPTSEWMLNDIWPDGHEFVVPIDANSGYYKILLSFYDPDTLDFLYATDAQSGVAIGEEMLINYLVIENPDKPFTVPASPLIEPVTYGADIQLRDIEITADQNTHNQRVNIHLFWQTQRLVSEDYTVFVHLINPNGDIIAQTDQQPLKGFIPTSLWRINEVIADQKSLILPTNVSLEQHKFHIGLYEFETKERLMVQQNDYQDSNVVVANDHILISFEKE